MDKNDFLRITGLQVVNFRGFRRTADLLMAPLTFLVGPNSSGKSSLADALLLLSQSRLAPTGSFVPRWQGPLVDLGSFPDAVYRHEKDSKIEIAIRLNLQLASIYRRTRDNDERRWPFRISYTFRAAEGDPTGKLARVTVEDEESSGLVRLSATAAGAIRFNLVLGDVNVTGTVPRPEIELAALAMVNRQIGRRLSERLREAGVAVDGSGEPTSRLVRFFESRELLHLWQGGERVSSGRGGPQRWYSANAIAQERARTLGSPSLLDRVDPVIVGSGAARARGASQKAVAQSPLATWLTRLEIADKIQVDAISPYHRVIRARDSVTRVESNLMELGYGASQVIPVLTGALSDAHGALVVEQPEIHLHPRAQGILADLLCETSRRRQVIVETHAVRFINRARLLIARGELPPENVVIHYVSRIRGASTVKTIGLDEDGEFTTDWPSGFFDERYEDTMQLLRLRQAKDQQ